MQDMTQPGVLPLRPLTTGEVLDAAVVILRTRARTLLLLGFALALSEQAILFPLRRLADVDSTLLPETDGLAIFGVIIVIGFATEAFSIVVLGGTASARAPRALLGAAAPAGRPARTGAVLTAALAVATLCAATAWTFLVLPVPLQIVGLVLASVATAFSWPFVYGLLGLAGPAVVIDGLGPLGALRRSVGLAARIGLRGMWIRVLGYLAWLAIRIGLALATVGVISLAYSSPSNTVDNLLLGGAWLTVNALAYPVLGCLDVALHLETRMRTEGLDIALRRSLRRGVSTEAALAMPARQAP